jgi:threonine dehydrogenase-like Zn-dependent dehydrogenase
VRATVMYGAGDVRVEQVPDATVRQPTDAVVRVVRSAICGSDLWAYGSMPASQPGRRMGHEFLGDGTHAVLECVGSKPALDTALGVVRDGGAISRVGLPQYTEGPLGPDLVLRNITITGGAAPARAYIEELLPDVLEGRIEPGRVFDRTISLGEVPDGYRAMADREALKVLIQP